MGALTAFAALVVSFIETPASNDRDWQPEVARPPFAGVNGERVTIHNVRIFNYRTETDFDAHWETRTHDLDKLDSMDIAAIFSGRYLTSSASTLLP